MDPDLIIVIILLVLSGFFSASETALMTVTPAKVRTLVEAKKPGSHYLAQLKKHQHKTLITILVGNNFVNIAASALTTVMMTEYVGSAAVGLATGVLTLIILIFGEVVPKSLATTYAPRLSLLVSPPLYIMGAALTPLIWLLDGLVRVILLILGTEKQKQVTEEELIAMASIGEEEGSIDEHERELIENVLEFNDIQVGEIMTPRAHIDAVPENYDLEEATQFIIHHTHSRIPVYREKLDNIVGILSIKDLLRYLHDEDQDDYDDITLRKVELARPLKVSAKMQIHDLFHKFKNQKTHIAMVVDKKGQLAGLITMEDLLEELVGDIEDEEDDAEERIRKLDEDHYQLTGHAQLDEIAAITGLKFEHPEHKNVSYLVTEELGHLPKKGQKITLDDWQFTVTKMYRHAILEVELKKSSKAPTQKPETKSD